MQASAPGFTLVELLVALAITGLLLGLGAVADIVALLIAAAAGITAASLLLRRLVR